MAKGSAEKETYVREMMRNPKKLMMIGIMSGKSLNSNLKASSEKNLTSVSKIRDEVTNKCV